MDSKNKIGVTVFVTGFVIMVFELIGIRVLSPFLGSSTIVWTSVIGVILTFMSIGYWYGGKLADRIHTLSYLSKILLLSAGFILAMNLGKNMVLKSLMVTDLGIISKSLISAILLFSGPSFLLAMVSPFAVSLSLSKLKNSGKVAGNIYALSTIGSILGTFSGGFLLIGWLGTNQILYLLSISLLILAGLNSVSNVKSNGAWILILLVGNVYYGAKAKEYLDFDTDYSRIFITQSQFKEKPVKFLSIDGYVNSGMFLDDPNKLVFDYTEFYDVFEFFNPSFENVVMFGGAGYSYPKHFQTKFNDKSLDVVEIDPKLTRLAEEYFQFRPSKFTSIIHQDARYFIQTTTKKYDVVLYDVLTSHLTVPFHLTTIEAFSGISEIMSDDGVVILNLIGDLNGKGARFIESEYRTLQQVFPSVFLFSAQDESVQGLHNYMIVALKQPFSFTENLNLGKYASFLTKRIEVESLSKAMVLTDDFSPVDFLVRN